MEQQEKAELKSQRTIERMLRSSFKSAIGANELGYEVDLEPLYIESMKMQLPSNSQSARRYIKVLSTAASAHFSQGDLDVAKEILVRIVCTAQDYKLHGEKKYKTELSIVEALIAHREMISTENGRVYFQDSSDPDALNLLPRSRTNGGRRRASFVSTFLKKKVGHWMRVQ